MEDDKIIDIWKTTHIEEDTPSNLSTSQMYVEVEIVDPIATITTQKEMQHAKHSEIIDTSNQNMFWFRFLSSLEVGPSHTGSNGQYPRSGFTEVLR